MNSNSNLERIKIFILKSAMIIWSQVLIFRGIQYFKVKHKLVHRMSDLALFILNSNSRMCLAQIKFSYINKWVKETKKCLNAFLCSYPGYFRTSSFLLLMRKDHLKEGSQSMYIECVNIQFLILHISVWFKNCETEHKLFE